MCQLKASQFFRYGFTGCGKEGGSEENFTTKVAFAKGDEEEIGIFADRTLLQFEEVDFHNLLEINGGRGKLFFEDVEIMNLRLFEDVSGVIHPESVYTIFQSFELTYNPFVYKRWINYFNEQRIFNKRSIQKISIMMMNKKKYEEGMDVMMRDYSFIDRYKKRIIVEKFDALTELRFEVPVDKRQNIVIRKNPQLKRIHLNGFAETVLSEQQQQQQSSSSSTATTTTTRSFTIDEMIMKNCSHFTIKLPIRIVRINGCDDPWTELMKEQKCMKFLNSSLIELEISETKEEKGNSNFLFSSSFFVFSTSKIFF